MSQTYQYGNRLLRALPKEAARDLVSQATLVDLSLRQVLQLPDSEITHCYFVETGIVSMVAVLSDGEPIEIGLVGSEGMTGLPVVLGAKRSPAEALVQLAGTALRVEADILKAAFDQKPAVRQIILRYAQAMHVQVSQTAACNSRHELEQRLARWLLMADDKYAKRPLPLTQEFLSMMLGVRRQQVSLSAALLQKAGYIEYRHGSINVLDRQGLESIACECYGAVAAEFTRLLK